jgi:hypothetical protein
MTNGPGHPWAVCVLLRDPLPRQREGANTISWGKVRLDLRSGTLRNRYSSPVLFAMWCDDDDDQGEDEDGDRQGG